MEINEIKDIALQLMDALASKKLGEVSIEAEGVKIRVKASAPAPVIAAAPSASPAPAAQSAAPAASAEPETAPADDIPAGTQVKSPLVGTFYSSPSPDEPPFVLAGQEVKEGDTLCIIEAMKVMNEIKAPCSGKVVRIMAQPGDLVEYNQLLCVIE